MQKTMGLLLVQTAMRVWDALLSEGAKILYRVALALLKTHEDRLMAQDNAGYVQREMKLASTGMHDRDALMKVWDRLCWTSPAFTAPEVAASSVEFQPPLYPS